MELEFKNWFVSVKEEAIEHFGYTETEVSNFSQKNWIDFFDQGLTPFEAVMQYLKKVFKHQNG